ncbi:MAG: hypothetical protein WB760_17395 [Xanthobacteraceae bacterium]
MRSCVTCQHLKRPEIDRRLAGGEPLTHIARDYGLSQSSLYRHRANCLGLGSSNEIKKDAARGSAAVALLPSSETLSGAYAELRNRIDQITAQAQQEGSLRIALAGLTSLRQTLDSQARLAAQSAAGNAKGEDGVQTTSSVDAQQIAERLIQEFDQEPEVKARIAATLLQMDEESRGSRALHHNDEASAGHGGMVTEAVAKGSKIPAAVNGEIPAGSRH